MFVENYLSIDEVNVEISNLVLMYIYWLFGLVIELFVILGMYFYFLCMVLMIFCDKVCVKY